MTALGSGRDLSPFTSRQGWESIANTLLDRIGSGRYAGRMPSQDEIAAEFGVSRGTAQRAERRLAARNVIYRVGSAYYVRPEKGALPDPQARVRETLLGQMASGKLRAGDLVPFKQQLAKELDVSSATVSKALTALAADGRVRFQHGIGYYVTHKGAALADREGGQQ